MLAYGQGYLQGLEEEQKKKKVQVTSVCNVLGEAS